MTQAKAGLWQAKAGLWRDQHHRYYLGEQGPFASVTSITGVLDKSGPLVGWAKRETAACAVRNIDILNEMIRDKGRDEAQKWLSGIPDRQRDEAAALGSRIHELADQSRRGEAVPNQLEADYLTQYFNAHGALAFDILHSETLVLGGTQRGQTYGGTFDLGVKLWGHNTLLDIKTGDNIYDEVALQLAGYADADFTASENDPTPIALPKWERFGVLHIRQHGWRLVPYVVNADTIEAFKAAQRLHRWRSDSKGQVQGMAIAPGVTP